MPIAARPTASDASWIEAGSVNTLNAFAIANRPSAGAPVRSGIWPATMLTATPVRNPIITECETNRVYRPSRSSPATTISTPAIRVSRNRAAGRWSAGTAATADPAASAAALVVVITIRRVLAVRPPAVGPAKLA